MSAPASDAAPSRWQHSVLHSSFAASITLVCATASAGSGGEFPMQEEVIVTARKLDERLQDVPMAVTAISGSQLEDLGAVDVKDVLRSVPGLSFSNVDRGQSRYNIRGISTNVASPTVGVYMDDISLVTQASLFTGALDVVLFDMERVEVLKGPQGTLYGGSAMGGSIKYVSARPDASEFSTRAAGSVASTEHGSESYSAEGVINIPLVGDVLAIRAGAYYRHDGGYIDNVANLNIENTAYSSTPAPVYTPWTGASLATRDRQDYNFSDVHVGRVSLLWQPDPSWAIRPAIFYQDSNQENPSYFLTNQPDFKTSYRIPEQETPDRTVIYSLDVNKEAGPVTLTSLSSYFDRKLTWDRDYSFFVGGLRLGPTNRALYNYDSFAHYPFKTKTFSQELRVASSPGSQQRFTWLAGLYYSDQKEDFDPVVSVYNGETSLIRTSEGLALSSESKISQYAGFGEVTFHATQSLDITAGVRVFNIEQDVTSAGRGPFNGGVTSTDLSIEEDGVNPKVGLAYKLADDHQIYATAAKGFRPGGPVTVVFPAGCAADLARLGLSATPDKFDSDDLWSYELGSKNEFDNRRLLLNAAVFYTDWKDIQQGVRLPTCGLSFTTNAGSARVQGAELETRFNVTPAAQVGLTATYTDGEITDPGFGSVARKGDEILDVPEWMGSVYGSYSIALSSQWDMQLRADYQYRGEQRRVFDGTQVFRYPDGTTGLIPYAATFQEDYDVVNAYLSVSNGLTNLRLVVTNALDERPLLDSNFSVGVSRSTTIRPRTIGLELSQQF